jgi:hypothetical protein
MLVKPKTGEPSKITKNGKEYWWCTNHEAWVRHNPSDCKGKGFVPNDKDKEKQKKKEKGNNDKKKLRYAAALSTVIDEDDEETDSGSETDESE